jgi:hypothetical protein
MGPKSGVAEIMANLLEPSSSAESIALLNLGGGDIRSDDISLESISWGRFDRLDGAVFLGQIFFQGSQKITR